MRLELAQYNSILFDDLRPWLPENKSEIKFQQKLNPTFNFKKEDIDDLEKDVFEVLKDHPYLMPDDELILKIKDNEITISGTKDEMFEPLIDIDLPLFFNYKTEYYYYLITNEETKIIKKLHEILAVSENEAEQKFLLNTAYRRIIYFLGETGMLLKQIDNTDDLVYDILPEDEIQAEKKINSYILSIFKTILIRLIFDIQNSFPDLLNLKKLTEDDIYITILHQIPPSITTLHIIVMMDVARAKYYISKVTYSKEKTLDYLLETMEILVLYFSTKINSKERASGIKKLAENIQAFENLLYVMEFGYDNENPTYEDLVSTDFQEEIFTHASKNITSQLEKQAHPLNRLVIINKLEKDVSFLKSKIQVDENILFPSIPRRILVMLLNNKTYLNANLSIDLSKVIEAKTKHLKTNLSVPQLAYLFKMLMDSKPDIFDVKTNKELYQFIEANFTTKGKDEGPSVASLNNLYSDVDKEVASFWADRLRKMLEDARKV